MARGPQEDPFVYSLLSFGLGRHPSHRGRRSRFSLSSPSIFNNLALLRVHPFFPLLPSPARVARDSINGDSPQLSHLFGLGGTAKLSHQVSSSPFLVHARPAPLPALFFPGLLSLNRVDGQLSSRSSRLGHHQCDSR